MLNVYKKILFYVPEKKYLVYVALLLTAISSVCTVMGYYYIYEFLNKFLVSNDIFESEYYAFSILKMFMLSSIIYIAAVSTTHIIAFRLESNLRKKGIDGLTDSSFRFFDMNTSGKTRRIIDDNASQTHNIVAHLIPDNAAAFFTPLLAFVLAFIIDIKLGAALVTLTIFGLISLGLMMGEKKFMEKYQKSLEKLSGEMVEYVRGIQVIKIFGANVNSFKALHEAIVSYSKNALTYSMSCKIPFVIFQLIFFGIIAVVLPLIVIFMDISHNAADLSVKLIMFLFLSGVLFISFMKIMYVSMYTYLGVSSVEKLEKIFEDMQKDKLEFGDKNNFKNANIEFENVSFAYDENAVLENLSFKLQEGKIYALVGKSGSGKSTIAKLISGFYKVDKGRIKIGDEDINSYTQESIMKNIAFVFQDAKLFKMSIYENVKLANPTAKREDILNALHLAGCDEILDKLKDRENTIIGSKGIFLSGGEKQRIAIARAILKDSKIIILDEASAAVDSENEHELQKAFSNLMKGKTVIMIAHRLTSIKSVDEILVIQDGKIIERGTDKELMNADSSYKYFQELYVQANDWRLSYEKYV